MLKIEFFQAMIIFCNIEFFPPFWLDVTILVSLKHVHIGSPMKVNSYTFCIYLP